VTDGHHKQDAAIVNSYDIRTGQGAWCGFFMSGRKTPGAPALPIRGHGYYMTAV
jgi:hypothetical protein